MTKPGPQLLDRLMAAVAARHRAGRRRFIFALAASAAIAVAGPGITMAVDHGGGDSTVRIAATDAHSGVWAQVTSQDAETGSQVKLEIKDGAGPRSCRLIAVGHDNSEETVTSWTVPGHDARAITMRGSSAMHTGEIARYDVRTADGEHLVTLQAR